MKSFRLAAILPSPPLDFGAALLRAKELGFLAVEVVALVERPPEHCEALADSGLLVASAAVGFGLPEGHTLDALSLAVRCATVALMKRQLADAATLGATSAFLVPAADPSAAALARFAEGCELLAHYAAQRMIRLCLKPFPGTALASAPATLDWLATAGLDGVRLALDGEACLASGSDPVELVKRAGRRLGHVQRATQPMLTALEETGYDGVLAVPFVE